MIEKPFIDEETGKAYKTEAALKRAITMKAKEELKLSYTLLGNCKLNGEYYEKGKEYEFTESEVEILKKAEVL